MHNKIWLIGAGDIAVEYSKVLKTLNKDFIVIGRGISSAKTFEKKTGVPVILEGLKSYLKTNPVIPQEAIVAVNLPDLKDIIISLVNAGVKRVFAEKPGFLYPEEVNEIYPIVDKANADVFLAYNRRFFSSVIKAQEIISNDGGVTSFNFEFTEWGHVIEKLNKPKSELENWLYANSTHVIDLAFYLGGKPTDLSAYYAGEINWHKPSVFSGAGKTDKGALFAYQANWDAPGRWGVEILTNKHRLILRPLEKLQIQEKDSINVNFVELDDSLDLEYKPGFFLETKAFLEKDSSRLCSIKEQLDNINLYEKIKGV